MTRSGLFVFSAALALASASCGPSAGEAVSTAAMATAPSGCKALETRPPNATSQRPSFAGQTRACASPSVVAFEVTVLAKGLEHPWAVEPLLGGGFLITERPGRMRVVSATGELGAPLSGLPTVDAGGQGGLLDVALGPSFASDRMVYWSYSEARDGGNATSVARGTLSADLRSLGGARVIFRALPAFDGSAHFGSRLVFGPDGMLYVTLGERSSSEIRPHAQRLDSHMGKIVRIRPDGSVPDDNPFVGTRGALPEIWSLGHRNVQSAAFDAGGRLWEIEHGAQGGDELNRVEKGKNYGWPVVTFGEEYSGSKISGSTTERAGFESPVYYWDPVIAPSGAQFYGGNAFPAWRGNLFVGALREQRLVRLILENERVIGEEHLLVDRGRRVRDVREGPDGALYVVTDESRGELWRIAPRR